MAKITVLAPGFFSSFQDMGRMGFRKFGVPCSGAMDSYSYRLANAIVNNKNNEAAIECTLTGPTLQFGSNTILTIVGADGSPMINGRPCKINSLLTVVKDDILSFGKLKYGVRYYIAVKGGFDVTEILESKSYYKGIADHLLLKEGDIISITDNDTGLLHTNANVRTRLTHFNTPNITVTPGPEFESMLYSQQLQLFKSDFIISKHNNRMAYQLEGAVENDLGSMITGPVLPGTVQLTSSGQLIVLMRDAQTTGGYPRVLQLTEEGINRLSQKRQGDVIRFRAEN
ncbi:biotin-dependent carboxyltransferase family protein [Sungkyunkwania multivorans]|uniref:Biotin-dependent carboxyltransferase family protein n=1 Tax=Sungkyunkwania multivorans TaxID=1173618 RepID=A0ABW3CVD3_9FLAO